MVIRFECRTSNFTSEATSLIHNSSLEIFLDRPCSPSTCRVSDCWSPTSDGDPCMVSSRPLGGIEKVIEYRPVPNGHGIELRRVTASADGPVEHIQVIQQVCIFVIRKQYSSFLPLIVADFKLKITQPYLS